MPKINLFGKAKTPLSCWKVEEDSTLKLEMSESEVIFRFNFLNKFGFDKKIIAYFKYRIIYFSL